MGITNGEKVNARRAEGEHHVYLDPRGERDARSEGEVTRDKQKRAYRANSKESSIFRLGSSDDGGMLSQLISDYRDQVAARKNEIRRIQEEKERLEQEEKRLKIEAEKLEARVGEFERLQQDLLQNKDL